MLIYFYPIFFLLILYNIDLSVSSIPEYTIQNISLNKFIASNDQKIILNFTQENLDINHFDSFIVKNSSYSVTNSTFFKIDNNLISITFDFSSLTKGKYYLFYKDINKNEFNTTFEIYIIEFSQDRQFYVLTNNFNNTLLTTNKTINCFIKGEPNLTILAFINKTTNDAYQLINLENSNYYYLPIDERFVGYLTYYYYYNENFYYTGLRTYIANTYENFYYINEIPKECYLFNEVYSFDFELIPEIENFDLNNISFYFYNPNLNNSEKYKIFNKKDTNFSLEIKDELDENVEYKILIIENNDYYTPLYSYNIYFTNISLHTDFSEFIYIHSPYILFETSCNLTTTPYFNFVNISNENDNFYFSCLYLEYTSILNELNCYLDNTQQTDENPNTIYKNNVYGYYSLSIPDNNIILSEKIFLSLPIEKSVFALYKDEYIEEGNGNNIYLTSNNFYLKNIDEVNIISYNTTTNNKVGEFKIPINLNIDLNNNSNSKILLNNSLTKNLRYYVNKIYRKNYYYIDENEYSNIQFKNFDGNNSYLFYEVTDFVIQWNISKRYIVIDNSYENESYYYNITLYAIGENSKLNKIFYNTNLDKTNISIFEKNETNYNQNYYSFFVNNETEQKYSIYYNYTKGNYTEIILLVDFPVLVVKNVSQILIFDPPSTCLYSNSSSYKIYNKLN